MFLVAPIEMPFSHQFIDEYFTIKWHSFERIRVKRYECVIGCARSSANLFISLSLDSICNIVYYPTLRLAIDCIDLIVYFMIGIADLFNYYYSKSEALEWQLFEVNPSMLTSGFPRLPLISFARLFSHSHSRTNGIIIRINVIIMYHMKCCLYFHRAV